MYKEFSPAAEGSVIATGSQMKPPRVAHPAYQQRIAIRILDIIVSSLALLWLAPIFFLLTLIVKSGDGGPVFFAQRRVGFRGETFYCFKFRTMVVDAENRLMELLANDPAARAEWERDHKLRNDPRIIPFGGFLRKWSLDEVPQFFNVLIGDMSIVGPRPIVPAESVKYGHYISVFQRVPPGITGLWQVSGRNDVSYRRRVACDVLYARRKSVFADAKIILATVAIVLTGRGSY